MNTQIHLTNIASINNYGSDVFSGLNDLNVMDDIISIIKPTSKFGSQTFSIATLNCYTIKYLGWQTSLQHKYYPLFNAYSASLTNKPFLWELYQSIVKTNNRLQDKFNTDKYNESKK